MFELEKGGVLSDSEIIHSFFNFDDYDNISQYLPGALLTYEVEDLYFNAKYSDKGGGSRNKIGSLFVVEGSIAENIESDCFFYLRCESKDLEEALKFETDLEITCNNEQTNSWVEFYLVINNIEEVLGLSLPATNQAEFLSRTYKGESDDGSPNNDLFINIDAFDIILSVAETLKS